jgi:tyrosine-specific transport protein
MASSNGGLSASNDKTFPEVSRRSGFELKYITKVPVSPLSFIKKSYKAIKLPFNMFKKRGESSRFFTNNKFLIATTTLVGTIVGAGVLGIPYVVAKTGFLYGFLLMVGLGAALIFLNLFAGEVVLRTKEQFQLTGYAGKYLGKWGKGFMTFSMVFSIYGALTAYLIGEGATLYAIFNWGSPLLFTLLFFILTFIIVYKGIKATGTVELILISLLVIIVALIGALSFNLIDGNNFKTFDITKIFLPYGVILFAFTGLAAIPELQEVLGKQKKLLKKSIIIGSLIPIILYVFFTFVVMGIVGLDQFELLEPNQRIATVALSIYAHPVLGVLANILAVLAMFTSYLTLSIALMGMYSYDYGISRKRGLLMTVFLPLLIASFGLTTFITVIGITGAVAGGIEGVLMILTYWKAKKFGDRKPEYNLKPHKVIGSVLIVMFIFGIIYQIWSNFL